MATSEAYLSGGILEIQNHSDFFPDSGMYSIVMQTADSFRNQIQHGGSFERLTVDDCLRAYSTQYVSARGDLLLVQNHVTADAVLGYSSYPDNSPSYDWACPAGSHRPCNPYNKTEVPSPDLWKPLGEIVHYCWSEKVEENCKVGFNLYFAITVMICNLIKVVGMFLTLRTQKQKALITLGDALESFSNKEDITTRGLCTYSTDQISLLWSWIDNDSDSLPKLLSPHGKPTFGVNSKKWRPKRWYWGSAATRTRWASCFVL